MNARFARQFAVTATGCWEWIGSRDRGGYGKFSWRNRWVIAHRWGYEHLVGPIPDGLQLDHLCRNRACVNPEHLEPVTARENSRRAKAQITECLRGHPYDAANTYVGSDGHRKCRACNRRAVAESKRRRQLREQAAS